MRRLKTNDQKVNISFVSGVLVNTVRMTSGFIPLLLVVGLGSFVAARPILVSYLQDETQAVTDLKAIMNSTMIVCISMITSSLVCIYFTIQHYCKAM